MKKLLFIVVISFFIININKSVDYSESIDLYFGENNKKYTYRYNDTNIKNILEDIEDNILINNHHIQNILVKANSVNLDLNNLEISNFNDLCSLLKTIRMYSKEKIYIKLSNNKKINKWIFKIKDIYDIIIMR